METQMRHATLIILLTAPLLTAPTSSLANLWSFLASAWAPETIDNGCGLDPNGSCQPAPTIENGCGLDPSGSCQPAPTIENGCGLDPDGKPACQQGS